MLDPRTNRVWYRGFNTQELPTVCQVGGGGLEEG